MATAAIFAIAALIGGAVDISRAWRAQTRLQAACDAAVLAGRKAVTSQGFDAIAEDAAERYFIANFDEDRFSAKDTDFTATSVDRGGTVEGSATAYLPPLLMQLFGFTDMELTTRCSASMGVGNSDIMMVLDTTGSMSYLLAGTTQTRLQALRASMKNFYDTVETALTGTNGRVRYGFVPYSSSVNVGQLLVDLDPDYLVDNWTIQSRAPIFKTVQTLTGYSAAVAGSPSVATTIPTYSGWWDYNNISYFSYNNCAYFKPADSGWYNSGPATSTSVTSVNGAGQQVVTTTITQPQTAVFYACNPGWWVYRLQTGLGWRNSVATTVSTANPIYVSSRVFDRWDYRPVTYDTSQYKLFQATTTNTGHDGAAQSSTWRGCIEERSTVSEETFTWSSINGLTPTGADDLDIDSPPDGSDATKWAPMWPEVAYARTQTINGVSSLSAANSTPTGFLVWSFCPTAARLLATMDKSAYYAFADSLVAEGSTYHDIGMVWGARLASPDGIWSSKVREAPDNGGEVSRHLIYMTDGDLVPNNQIQSAWGIEFYDRRVTDDGAFHDIERHSSRFLALCEATKAKGIRIWVIAFAQAMTTPLQTCASDASAFTAANAGQLDAAFQSIAKQVGELRVVQ